MSDSETKQETQEPVKEQADAPAQTVTLNVDDFKSVIQSTVESVLKANRSEEFREKAAEYNEKIATAVNQSQAQLLKPEDNSKFDMNYIHNVFAEDDRKRRHHPEGKALYGEKGEDFIKAKIILLKKIGLSDEEILKELKTMPV